MPRWVLVLTAALVIAAAAVAFSLFAATRDPSRVGVVEGPGEALTNQCASHLAPPAGFEYSSQPPTSGPHEPRLPTGDERRLADDELLHALELGNVAIAYDSRRPPPELRALREKLAGDFDVELAAAGQAVLLVRHSAADGVTALAWNRRLNAEDPADPALREFAEYWLGRGADDGENACRGAG